MRLKDDIISVTGSGGGRIEENGQIKRRESPDFDDNNDISGLEDENIIGGGLQRDISLDKLKIRLTYLYHCHKELWSLIFFLKLNVQLI